jgi:hypothetical protein
LLFKRKKIPQAKQSSYKVINKILKYKTTHIFQKPYKFKFSFSAVELAAILLVAAAEYSKQEPNEISIEVVTMSCIFKYLAVLPPRFLHVKRKTIHQTQENSYNLQTST